MVSSPGGDDARPAWFVGAYSSSTGEHHTPRFVQEGIWENGYTDRYLELVNEIQPGDKIAIKAQFNRTEGLPFDNRGHPVSLMQIKATGIVRENLGDGRHLTVDWTPVEPPREWFFFTYVGTVWKVNPGSWRSDALIRFTFDGEEQDLDSFRNFPYWRDRFGDEVSSPVVEAPEVQEYLLKEIINDGCFLPQPKLETILTRLKSKKNVIMQGPPGTGKTWLAKKLAFALIEQESDHLVRRFQFHPNMSYEDFIRGYRPDGDGTLNLVDGPFLEVVSDAKYDPDNCYVMVIEEINRGNPAQIFGEMLTLLEADKRDPSEALTLAYPKHEGERVHIPPNVYVIGTMNVADRSIAMVDLALRRRFAFVDLEPVFGEVWRNWVNDKHDIPINFLESIEQRMASLNDQIAVDRTLGPQFRVGHSYVTPSEGDSITNPAEWFRQVVETEIGPLLEEYWFDSVDTARNARSELLADL